MNLLTELKSNNHLQANSVDSVQDLALDHFSVNWEVAMVELQEVAMVEIQFQNNQLIALQLPKSPVELQLKTPEDASHPTLLDSFS
jgi:hypothetical protein